jgi:hypothetical protein
MRILILLLVLALACPAQMIMGVVGAKATSVTNLLVSPSDLTNAAWIIAGTGCTKTNATHFAAAGAGCTLYQQVDGLSTSTNYTVAVTVTKASGTDTWGGLTLYTAGWATLCSADAGGITTVPKNLTCTASTGANTSVLFSVGTWDAVTASITVSGATLHK